MESNKRECASEIDSCLKSIMLCSEFRVPLSMAKPHMLKLYTKAKDLKNVCKKEAKFIRCMQGANEICKNRPSSAREKELLRIMDFAEQLCGNACGRIAYLEHANCINNLLSEATSCLSMGIQNAEKTADSSEAMCRLQTSVRDCLIQNTRKKCGFIAAGIQKKLFEFERGVDFACYDFEGRSKNIKTDSSCDSSQNKHESKECVRLLTSIKSITFLSENMEKLLHSVFQGSFPPFVLQNTQSRSSDEDQNAKRSKEGTFTGTGCSSTVDASSSENSTVHEFPTTTETSPDADEMDANTLRPESPTTSDELSAIKIVLQYIDNAILMTDLVLNYVSSLNGDSLLNSEYAKAKEFLSTTKESLNDKHSGVDSTSNRVNTENTKSVIIPETRCAADESCAKINSDSSHSEAYIRVSSPEHQHSNLESTAEMYKRRGDDVLTTPLGDEYTHENASKFSLYSGWSKEKKYVGCGLARISWVKDSPMKRVYCSTHNAKPSEVPFKCTVRTDEPCVLAKNIADSGILNYAVASLGMKLVVYGRKRNEKDLKKRALIDIRFFKPDENFLRERYAEQCEKRQMDELRNRLERIGSELQKIVSSQSRAASASKKKRPLLHRSGMLLSTANERQHHECDAINYVLIGNPYYPQCKNEEIEESKDNIYFVKASVKIEAAIRLQPKTSFKNA